MLAIKNAAVSDGSGKKLTIIIRNGTILSSGPDAAVPEEASVINAEGLYVLPGLIDAHTHFGGSSSFERPACGTRAETYDFAEAREGFLNWGVTTVRTCGDRTKEILNFRDDVNRAYESFSGGGAKDPFGEMTAAGYDAVPTVLRSPRIVSCGPFFQGEGGHPWATVYMKDPDIAETAVRFIKREAADSEVSEKGSASPADIEAEVEAAAAKGVDFLKAFYGHINKLDYPNPVPHMSKEQLRCLIKAAHGHGLSCAVHVDGPEEMMDAIEAGADVIEHMIAAGGETTAFTPEQIRTIKASGASVVPTMISIHRFDKTPGFPSVYEELKAAVKEFYEAGIPLAVGCDSGIPFVPFGESLHDEMACLSEAGIPNAEILKMATSGNARLLGLSERIGTLDPGKDADLLLLGSDPLTDIRNTRDLRLVMRGGEIIKSAL